MHGMVLISLDYPVWWPKGDIWGHLVIFHAHDFGNCMLPQVLE